MAAKPLPSPEDLRQFLRYEPDTGRLFWMPRPVELFQTVANAKQWNSSWAGAEAFTSTNFHGYRQGKVWQRQMKGHRVVWAIHYGEWPSKAIDHINGDRADNRIANLRLVTTQENGRNLKLSGRNSSGVIGVSFNKKRGVWRAQIGSDPLIFLGQFKSFDDAVKARKVAEAEFGYHPNHGKRL